MRENTNSAGTQDILEYGNHHFCCHSRHFRSISTILFGRGIEGFQGSGAVLGVRGGGRFLARFRGGYGEFRTRSMGVSGGGGGLP